MDIDYWCAQEDGLTAEGMAEMIREGHETGGAGYTWCLVAEMTDDDAGLARMILGRLEFSPAPSDDEWWDLLYASLSRNGLLETRAVTFRAFLAMAGKHPDEITIPDEGGILAFAASFGRPDVVDMLLRAGASPNAPAGRPSPLERLVAELNGDAGRVRTAELLLGAGARPVAGDGKPLWERCADDVTASLLKAAWEAESLGVAALPGIQSEGGHKGP